MSTPEVCFDLLLTGDAGEAEWLKLLGDAGLRPRTVERVRDPVGRSEPSPETEAEAVLLVAEGDTVPLVGLVRGLHRATSGLPLVVARAHLTTPETVDWVRAGAINVVPLPTPAETLFTALQKAAVESRARAPHRHEVLRARRGVAALNASEKQVLTLLLRGLANKQAAVELGMGLRTIELKRARIYEKMGATSLAELVRLCCLAAEA